MKRFSAKWRSVVLPLLLQGCYIMDHDGSPGDDGIATICGVIGVIAVLVGLSSKGNTVRLILVGAILIIA